MKPRDSLADDSPIQTFGGRGYVATRGLPLPHQKREFVERSRCPINIDKKALKGIVDEIEASRARQRGETEHQREVMKRAKAHQLDAKAIRIVLQRRAMGESKREEQDYYVHSYELALGGKKAALEALEQGASVREAAKAGGISTGAAGNLAKTVQKSSFVDEEVPPVATHTEREEPNAGLSSSTESDEPRSSALNTSDSAAAEPVVPTGNEGRAGERGPDESRFDGVLAEGLDFDKHMRRRREASHAPEAPPTESLGAVARPSSAERVASSINPDEDDLKIPLFLTKAGQRASAPSKEK